VWAAIVPATDGHLFIIENPTIYSLYAVPVRTFVSIHTVNRYARVLMSTLAKRFTVRIVLPIRTVNRYARVLMSTLA
jgi:hypothetical protein